MTTASYPQTAVLTTSAAIVAPAATASKGKTFAENMYWDFWMPFLPSSGWKVLSYLIRHLCGYHKDADAISIQQFEHGIVTRDGRRIDYGTQLSHESIIKMLNMLVDLLLVIREHQIDEDGADAATLYRLNPNAPLPPMVKKRNGKFAIASLSDEKSDTPVSTISDDSSDLARGTVSENLIHKTNSAVYKRKDNNKTTRSATFAKFSGLSSVAVSSKDKELDAEMQALVDEMKCYGIDEPTALEFIATYPDTIAAQVKYLPKRKPRDIKDCGGLLRRALAHPYPIPEKPTTAAPKPATPAPTMTAQRPQAPQAASTPPKAKEKAVDPLAFYESLSPAAKEDVDRMAWNRAAITAANNPPLLAKIEALKDVRDMSSPHVAAAVRVARRDVIRAQYLSG